MKRLLRIALKVVLFIVIFIACALILPYGSLADLLTGNMSLDTAIKISEIVLDEAYPEPYEFVDSLISVVLNIPVSLIIYLLVIKVVRRIRKS